MGKGRQCSESCLELMLAELQAHYLRQPDGFGPPGPAAIEAIGFRVGRQLVERYTKDRNRMTEHLEIIKFICRDFWTEVFKKQVDNLRTNHRGTFVLRDNSFRWTLKMAAGVGAGATPGPLASGAGVATGAVGVPLAEQQSHAEQQVAREQLILPCALVRGALCHLGVDAAVSADVSNAPVIEFNVYIRQR